MVTLNNNKLTISAATLSFAHQAVFVEACGASTGSLIPNQRNKIGGQAKVLDYLFYEDEGNGTAYLAKGNGLYGAFLLGGEKKEFFIDNGRVIFKNMTDVGGRFHYCMVEAGLYLELHAEGAKLLNKIRKVAPTKIDVDTAFEFNNEVWNIFKTKEVSTEFECDLEDEETFEQIVNTFVPNEEWGNKSVSSIKNAVQSSASKTVVSNDELFERIKKGEFVINYDFGEKADEYKIPLSFLEGYVPIPNFWYCFKVLNKRLNMALNREGDVADIVDVVNFAFEGKGGTSKTTTAKALAAAFGLPCAVIECGEFDEAEKYGKETKVLDGKFTVVDSLALTAMEEGWMLVYEEADLPDDGVLKGAINQRLEAPFFAVVEKKGKFVQAPRHKLCVMVCTANPTESGVNMDSALLSRFSRKCQFTDFDESLFIGTIVKRTGCTEETAKWVYELYKKIASLLVHEDVHCKEIRDFHFTMRQCFAVAEDAITEGITPEEAIEHGFMGCIAERSPQAADYIWSALKVCKELDEVPDECN